MKTARFILMAAMLLTGGILFAAPSGFDFAEHFAKREAWEQGAEAFVSANGAAGFRVADAKKTTVDCLGRGRCVWNGMDVWESRIYFDGDAVSRIELSLYNRGDDKSGGLNADALKKLLDDATAAIGGKPNKKKSEKPQRGSVVKTHRWTKPDVLVELSWGETGSNAKDMHADFVKVVLSSKKSGGRTGKKVSSITRAKANVQKNDAGDIWIDGVPMVDQGQKGYCAAATAERVLRYYGFPVDEHEIAQIAGTTAQGGTSTLAMRETVRKAASKYRLGYAEIVNMNEEPQKAIKAYNSVAKRLKKPEISFEQFLHGNVFMIGEMIEAMQPDVLHEMRQKDSRAKQFTRKVREQIEKGNPVFWGVTLGIWKEPGLPQQAGGHMRLIIGYNKKTDEILYSDSWGAAHTLKRMPADWAFTMTDNAFFLRPL